MEMNFSFSIPIKRVKDYIVSNKKLYLLCFVVILVGVFLGVYLIINEFMEENIYTRTDLTLSEIILGERSFFSLFFSNLATLLVPIIIIFALYTNKYTKILTYFYLAYQGLLLGASITSLISEYGLGGALNALIIVVPINLVNFFVVVSMLVVSYKRFKIAKLQRLSFGYSLKLFLMQYIGILVGAIFASLVYALLYPIILRTSVVVTT